MELSRLRPLVLTLALVAVMSAMAVPRAAAEGEIEATLVGFGGDAEGGTISAGQSGWAEFKVVNNTASNVKVELTTQTSAAGCQLTLDQRRTEPVYVEANGESIVTRDSSFTASPGCKDAKLAWKWTYYTYAGVKEIPESAKVTPTPTPSPTPTPTPTPTQAASTETAPKPGEAQPTQAQTSEAASPSAQPEAPARRQGSTLPWLLAFIGVLLAILVAGVVVVAQRQRNDY